MEDTLVNGEWDFITREINEYNNGGTKKRHLLFELQILLSVLSRTKNLKEKFAKKEK